MLSSDVRSAVTRKSEVIMKRNCSICLKRVEGDDAPVLAMGGYGNPKVLCDECEKIIDELKVR